MTYQLAGLRTASSGGEALPESAPCQQAEAEASLLRALEHMHAGGLTDAQRREMAQSLADQRAASAVLRRFSLGNDDAPCFVKIPVGGAGDE